MAKKDFSILLEPASGSNTSKKDIALVSDVYRIGQQAKNIILSHTGERPFNPIVGLDFDPTELSSDTIFYVKYKSEIKGKLEALIKDIKNIKVSMTKKYSEMVIGIEFDYVTNNKKYSGNYVTVTIKIS